MKHSGIIYLVAHLLIFSRKLSDLPCSLRNLQRMALSKDVTLFDTRNKGIDSLLEKALHAPSVPLKNIHLGFMSLFRLGIDIDIREDVQRYRNQHH